MFLSHLPGTGGRKGWSFLFLPMGLFRDLSLEFSPGFSVFGVQGRGEGTCRVSRQVSGRFWMWPVSSHSMGHDTGMRSPHSGDWARKLHFLAS